MGRLTVARGRLGGGRRLSSMELSLRDMPFGMGGGGAGAAARASLAVTDDGESWLLRVLRSMCAASAQIISE
jgi:hypothetical protein